VDGEVVVPKLLSESIEQTREWHKLHKEISQSNGVEYERRLYEKNGHIYTLLKNAYEIAEYVDDIKLEFKSGIDCVHGAQSTLKTIQLEFTRKLFNFLASTKMLIEYTRAFMRKNYRETKAIKVYQELIDNVVKNDPICNFVNDLRNLGTHVCNPMQCMDIVVFNLNVSVYDYFDLGGLLSQFEWSPIAKAYISEKQGGPDLLRVTGVISEYIIIIKKLHGVVDSILAGHHYNDIARLACLRQKYQSVYPAFEAEWPIIPIDLTLPPMGQQ
jgi:hypothetical protein